MKYSNSGRNFLRKLKTGIDAASPSAHSVLPEMPSGMRCRFSRSARYPFARADALDDVVHPGGALATRRALPAGFVAVEAREHVQHAHHARALGDDDDAAGPEHAARLLQRRRVERDVLDLGGGQHGRGAAAGNHGLERLVAEDAARIFEDDALQRVTGRALVDARASSRDRKFRRAAFPDCSCCRSRRRPRRHCATIHGTSDSVSTLLTTVGAPVQTSHRRKRRLVARISFAALERIDQARLLAAHVSAGAAVHDDVAGERAAEDALADEPRSCAPPPARRCSRRSGRSNSPRI